MGSAVSSYDLSYVINFPEMSWKIREEKEEEEEEGGGGGMGRRKREGKKK